MVDIPRNYPVGDQPIGRDPHAEPDHAATREDYEGKPGWVGAKNMTFSQALDLLKLGHPVARAGWNGKGMFIVMMPRLQLPAYSTQGTERKVNDRTAKWIGEDTPLDCNPYIAMWTADKKWQPGWLASQTDMFAADWAIYDGIATQSEMAL